MRGILLLDQSYRPLRVIPVRRAVGLVLKGKVEGVTDETVVTYSANDALEIPVVLRLGYAINVPFRRDEVRCTRRGILARDGHTCQFIVGGKPCNERADTIDHVYPKGLGGDKMSWTNLVASCETHNAKKAMRTLSETGWKLKREPFAPKGQMRLIPESVEVPASWAPYLV
jgi:hypothetical protein